MPRKIKPNSNVAPWEMRKQTVRPHGQSRTGRTLVIIFAIALIIAGIALGYSVGKKSRAKNAEATPDYYAVIDIKDYGTVTVHLDGSAAPLTVKNFVELANRGFYNGLTFHRIMEGFMMQGGESHTETVPSITGEFAANGFDNPLSHTRGAISMARTDVYDSATSQFFIVHKDSTFLDGKYAAFGYVVEGMDVVDAICESAKPTDNNGTIPAEEQPVISSITITEAEPAKG